MEDFGETAGIEDVKSANSSNSPKRGIWGIFNLSGITYLNTSLRRIKPIR